MLCKLMLPVRTLHEGQMDPHWLLKSRLSDEHEERIWQIRRAIFPPGKWQIAILRVCGTDTDTEGTRTAPSSGPSLPKQSASCTLTLSFLWIAHSKELNHSVGKGEAAIGRTLPRMLVWRPLMQPKSQKLIRFGRAYTCAHEQMVQLNLHARKFNS